jgi:hypothetical protein
MMMMMLTEKVNKSSSKGRRAHTLSGGACRWPRRRQATVRARAYANSQVFAFCAAGYIIGKRKRGQTGRRRLTPLHFAVCCVWCVMVILVEVPLCYRLLATYNCISFGAHMSTSRMPLRLALHQAYEALQARARTHTGGSNRAWSAEVRNPVLSAAPGARTTALCTRRSLPQYKIV